MTDEEAKYTYEEWRLIKAQRECNAFGHSWSFVMSGSSKDPTSAFCDNGCGHPGMTMTRKETNNEV